MTQIKNDLVQHREISHRSDSSRTHIYLGLVGIDMRHSTTLLSDSRSHAIARGRVASTLFGTCKNRTKSPLGRRVAPVDAAVEIHDRIGSALRSVKGKSIQPLHRGMFKFDTKTQNPKPKRWSATGGVVRRIMASFLGRRTSRLGLCGHTSFLTRHALSSLTSPPGLFLTLMSRLFLRRVPTLHTMRAPTGSVQVTAVVVSSHSSVCLWSVCRVSVCL